MAIQRRGHEDFHTWVDARDLADDSWQVSLEMLAEREEIGDHDDPLGALFDQPHDRARKIGLT